ncbi:nitroreductase [Acuticoccus sp. MNP-M23]|uniref:nitroreductase family protein n=1 Tax=Acuticoccus sp. MNP-M23 TaxID=3072793 RepID=UPI0028154067|nr:nitroreductase [Acuticoccus sp. MNP-M23]WMS43314.1 nitroreductase [Acuticoccus sp. MNP-M23]
MSNLRDYLATRRTVPSVQLTEPAPDAAMLDAMLKSAARVPDHGKLAPWRFIVFAGDARVYAGEQFCAIAHADDNPARREAELTRFTRAPLVVAVVSTAEVHAKIPEWEQILSAGAVCLNLMHAAAAHGFSAQWLTEWMAYDDAAKASIGIKPAERVAGFIHIGTPGMAPADRARPDMEAITTRFVPPADPAN